MKIVDNATTDKCGTCEYCTDVCLDNNEDPVIVDVCTITNKIVASSTIDKDCPLQDCEVIKTEYITLRYWDKDFLYTISKDDVDYIIIVKKKRL